MLPQPLSRQECFEALKANLLEAYKLIDSRSSQVSLQWLSHMENQFKSGFKSVKDALRDANWRTCPKTNERDCRRQPLPENIIGCLSFDNGNFPWPSDI